MHELFGNRIPTRDGLLAGNPVLCPYAYSRRWGVGENWGYPETVQSLVSRTNEHQDRLRSATIDQEPEIDDADG
jgi:hypothetical protein